MQSLMNDVQLAKSRFQSSPVRKLLSVNGSIPFPLSTQDKEKLLILSQDLKTLESKIIQPLKIVIIGEVKAGKSTLLNAILEDRISPTDILEATAVIFEVVYAESDCAVIQKYDGSSETISVDEVYSILQERQADQNLAAAISSVQIMRSSERFKRYNVVDTPGLLSVTKENLTRTKAYIQQADVILWVLNANYVGQRDVLSEIETVSSYGKPMMCLVNRIDMVKGDTNRLIEYVTDLYGVYFKGIYPLSAKMAFTGIMNGMASEVEQSGFTKIMEYIDNQIARSVAQAKETQKLSIKASLEALVDQDNLMHSDIHKEMMSLLDEYMLIEKDLHYFSGEIMSQVQSKANLLVSTRFLENERISITSQIKSMSKLAPPSQVAAIEQAIKQVPTEQVLHDEAGKMVNDLEKTYIDEWQKVISIISDNLKGKVIQYNQQQEQRVSREIPKGIDISSVNSSGHMMPNTTSMQDLLVSEDVKKGLFYGGGAGLALAAYAAVLGPAASALTIGSAMLSFIPPVAIAGLLVGGVKTLLDRSRKSGHMLVELDEAINQKREYMQSQIVEPYILNEIRKSNAAKVEFLKSEYVKLVFNNWSSEQIRTILADLQVYIRKEAIC